MSPFFTRFIYFNRIHFYIYDKASKCVMKLSTRELEIIHRIIFLKANIMTKGFIITIIYSIKNQERY